MEPAKASSAARKASSGAIFARPVVARALEPALWFAVGAALTVVLAADARVDAFRLLAMFLVVRLCVDTAANLVVAPWLQEAPYDQRRIRRGLSSAKLVFALAASVTVPLILHALGLLRPGAAAAIAAAGGFERLLLLLTLASCSYAISTPSLREHRGTPVARPNPGPAAGALAALIAIFVVEPTAPATFAAITCCVAAGNLVVGGWQRFADAARRLRSPVHFATDADVRTASRPGAGASARVVAGAARLMPFLLLPTLAPIAAVTLRHDVAPFAALLALAAAALPPLAFDAARGGRRFEFAALACAALAAAAWIALPPPLARDPVLAQSAVLLVAAVPASRAWRRGGAASIALAILLYALSLVWVHRVPALARVPVAEIAFLAFAAWSARGCARAAGS